MSKPKKRKKNRVTPKKEEANKLRYPLLTFRLKRWIVSILMLILSLIIALSFFEKSGEGGEFIFKTLDFLIGRTIFLVPFLLVLGGILFLKPQKKRFFIPVFGGIVLFIVAISGLFEILNHSIEKKGGFLGHISSWPFLKFFGQTVSIIIFLALVAISLLIFWEFTPKKPKKKEEVENGLESKKKNKEKNKKEKEDLSNKVEMPEFEVKKIGFFKKKISENNPPKIKEEGERTVSVGLEGEYKVPPLDFFSLSSQKALAVNIESNSLIIKKTLNSFGIPVEMGEINVGPSVTQYTLKPAEGVKLTRITALANDLSLSLAAHPIRIEAPIPGRSLVGVEVPNKSREMVVLRDLLSQPDYQKSLFSLIFALGKDVAGKSIFVNLEKMPHLLVAGSTGSGKTIFLQSLILSLIYRNSPKILKLILVDPKRVEFSIYEKLPHLLTPVIFSAQKTVNVLNWLTKEMERRFDVLSEVRARDIGGFNEVISKNIKLKEEYGVMPYVVLIIDELADLIAAKGKEIESGVVRLSQLARAVGIHLVVATQRPSVDVITGLIKANLTSRVAFQTASQIDSRTILDSAGAESLLGSGDMLYLSSEFGKPKRIQGSFVLQRDVKKVIDFIEKENDFSEKEDIEKDLRKELKEMTSKNFDVSGLDDPLYEEAKRIIFEYKRASASLLQRRLQIGYARAARLLDILEEKGVVGPASGAKPREIYGDNKEEFQETDLEDF